MYNNRNEILAANQEYVAEYYKIRPLMNLTDLHPELLITQVFGNRLNDFITGCYDWYRGKLSAIVYNKDDTYANAQMIKSKIEAIVDNGGEAPRIMQCNSMKGEQLHMTLPEAEKIIENIDAKYNEQEFREVLKNRIIKQLLEKNLYITDSKIEDLVDAAFYPLDYNKEEKIEELMGNLQQKHQLNTTNNQAQLLNKISSGMKNLINRLEEKTDEAIKEGDAYKAQEFNKYSIDLNNYYGRYDQYKDQKLLDHIDNIGYQIQELEEPCHELLGDLNVLRHH